jgi:hypothetical protein
MSEVESMSLSELEVVVSDREKKIKDGEISEVTIRNWVRGITTQAEAVAVKDRCGIDVLSKVIFRLDVLYTRPRNRSNHGLGYRAVECHNLLSRMYLSVSEEFVPADIRPQFRAQNQEMMQMSKGMWDSMFPQQ